MKKIIGTALKVATKQIVSTCGFKGKAGYSTIDVEHGADAYLSFMPRTSKPHKLTSFEVEGRKATIVKYVASEYISGMYTFYIKYGD